MAKKKSLIDLIAQNSFTVLLLFLVFTLAADFLHWPPPAILMLTCTAILPMVVTGGGLAVFLLRI